MAWYAYCIGEKLSFPDLARHRKPVPLEGVHGVSGSQVFVYPASELAVIVSEYDPAEGMNPRAGVDHARVIAECFKQSTVLPFRFGTVFMDDDGLRRSIRSNQRQFALNIEKLRGKTEMHLKIHIDDNCRAIDKLVQSANSIGVGREYLLNLRETATRQRDRQTRARAVAFQMHRTFMPLEEEVSCRLTDDGRMLLDIAHLIDRKHVERYQNKYTQAIAMMRECQLQLSGPWPPYHFVHLLTRSNQHSHATAAVDAPIIPQHPPQVAVAAVMA